MSDLSETPRTPEHVDARTWVRWGMRLRRGERPESLSSPQRRLGQLELAEFQARAAHNLCETSLRFGGALLADAPGLGKTRVALVAAHKLRKITDVSSPILCCAPSRLLPRWRRAFTKAGLREGAEVVFCSHTALSRWDDPVHDPCVLIVDEAHRLRNPKARRSQMLAKLASRAHTLLVTATPVCKSLDDLHTLFSFFLAEDASRMLTGEDLGALFAAAKLGDAFGLERLIEEVVTRREQAPAEDGFGKRPGVRLKLLEYTASEQEEWIWQNLGRIASDLELVLLHANWPKGLLAEHLLRRWESGPRALMLSLESLRNYHVRWLDAARQGVHLDRSSFKELFEASSRDDGQGVFPFLLPESEDAPSQDLIDAVRANLDTLEELLDACARCRQNFGRDEAIVELLEELHDEKFLIFTGFVDAARGLFDTLEASLGSRAQIGLMTGEGAVATGVGAIGDQELLARFAPRAQEHQDFAEHHEVRVLIATDCLSEGMDLQDCGRIILADLPYTPLAVEQRVGRLLRPGSPHDEVVVYLPRPSSWPDSLGMRRRLDERLALAEGAHARYIAAGVLSTSSGEQAPRDDILAARETLDRWSHRELEAQANEVESSDMSGDWEAYHPRGHPGLWALVRGGTCEERASFAWWHISSAGRIRRTCAQVLPDLIEFFEQNPMFVRGEHEPAERFLASREAERLSRMLLAAHLAPFHLPASSPQVRLWREVVRENTTLEARTRWRARLLRPHTRGVELLLARLAERELSAREVFGALEQWLPESREESDRARDVPRLDLMSTVLVCDRMLAPCDRLDV